MYDRNILSGLGLVKFNTADVVQKKQNKGPKHVGSNIQEFNNGQPVLVRNHREGRWTTGSVTAKTAPLSYQVDVNGSAWRRYVDQMKTTLLRDDSSEPIPPVYVPEIFTPRDITSQEPLVVPDRSTKSPPADHPVPSVAEHQEPLPKPASTPRRYPQRIPEPTQKLNL